MRARFAVVILLVAIVCGVSAPTFATAQTASPATTTSSLIVKVVTGLTTDQQAEIVARNGGTLTSVIPALRLLVVAVTPEEMDATLARYHADPHVHSAEVNGTHSAEALPTDPLYLNQWALPRIGWDQTFGVITPTGSVKVALLDTGVDASHPELAGKVLPGTSILDGSTGTTDPSGHGTWLAGLIAAQTDTVPADGIAAVGYAGVRIVPVTVLNANGEGQDSDVIAGVIWAADNGADVILMAFSSPHFSSSLQDAIDYAWSKGIVVVAAVGNNAVSTPTFPAGHRGVMGVAATDQADSVAWFSNSGQAVFIAAPGVDIQTIDLAGNYIVISGTSTAAAHVAGLAALMKAVDPTLTNGVIVARIARNADPAGAQDETGNGRINVPRTLADTSTEFIEPAGAAPVGNGGPFVGPYQAAACTVTSVSVVSQSPAAAAAGDRITYVNITLNKSNGNCSGAWSINWIGGPAPAGTAAAFSPATFAGSGSSKTTTLTITTTGGTTPAGSRTFRVTAGGGDTGGSVTSGSFSFQLNKRSTQTVVSSSQNPSAFGEAVTFTATVTGTGAGAGNPSSDGNVTFKAGGSAIAGCSTLAVNADGVATCTTLALTVAGSPHAITAEYRNAANFADSNGTLTDGQTVNAAPVTVTITGGPFTYDGTPHGATVTVSPSGVGHDVSYTGTLTSYNSSTAPTNADTYTVTVSITDSNYVLSGPGTGSITIDKKAASVTPNAASKTYGDADPTLTGTLSGFLSTDGVTATYTRTAGETVAGSPYTISAALSPVGVLGNYNITANTAPFTIDRRDASVTPNAAGKTYGDADPTLTGTLSGFLGPDGVTATYTRTAGETVGGSPYTISATLSPAAVLGNYNITANTAPFTIDKRNAAVTPNAAGKTYGDGDPTFTGTVSGFLGPDGVTATYTRTAGETVGGSPYTISATLSPAAVLGNYSITYNTASFTITQRAASVIPTAASKTLGAADPVLSGTLSGFLPGDGVTAAYTRTPGEAIGTYTISGTLSPTAVLSNYNVTYDTALFTIVYRWSGFFQPVDNVPVMNVTKAGSAIPVKFSLHGNQGLAIFAPGFPAWGVTTCTSMDPVSVVEQTVTAAGSSLTYDASADQYIYVWKTNKTWTGCRQLILQLNDGTVHRANFQMR